MPHPGRRAILAGGLAAAAGSLLGHGGPATGLGQPSPVAPAGMASGSELVADSSLFNSPPSYGPLRPPTRWGVNYTPSRVWWDIWEKWDPHRVEDDLAAIASLGVDHIRVQLLWSVFQPTAAGADPVMLERFVALLDIAARLKLDVCPSVVTSALSGAKFVPAWANGRDWIREPALVEAQARYIRDLGKAAGGHHNLLGFDLGNENLGHAPDAASSHLRAWASRLIHASRIAAPGKLHTVSPNGLFTVPYPEIVASIGDLSVIHPWCFIGGSATGGRIEHGSGHHAEFNVELIRSFHDFSGPRRHVWVQEVGAPRVNFYSQEVVPAYLSADFLEQTVRGILTCEDVFGITWWCSHEIDPRTQAGRFRAPEYTLGLFGLSGKPKPMAARLAALVAESRRGRIPSVIPRDTAVVGTDAGLFDRVQVGGTDPAIVQPARQHDAAYLARRGITSLIH